MTDDAAVSADDFVALDGLEPDGRADPEPIDQDAVVVAVASTAVQNQRMRSASVVSMAISTACGEVGATWLQPGPPSLRSLAPGLRRGWSPSRRHEVPGQSSRLVRRSSGDVSDDEDGDVVLGSTAVEECVQEGVCEVARDEPVRQGGE